MKKETKLDKVYAEFETKYSNSSEDEMKKEIENLEKEINGKESTLEKLEGDSKERIQKQVEESKKRLENLKGYSKNKTQIEGIKNIKSQFEAKLQQEKHKRDESKNKLEALKESDKNLKEKLVDVKYTESLTNDEYNNLMQLKLTVESRMKEQKDIFTKAEAKIVTLQSEIGKCDLAWKTLFTNKDWDEISRRAVDLKTRYTRKLDSEKDTPIKPTEENSITEPENESKENKEEKVTEPHAQPGTQEYLDEITRQQTAKNVQEIMSERKNETVEKEEPQQEEKETEEPSKEEKSDKEEEKKEETAVAVRKDKFSFRALWNKIVAWVRGEDKETAKNESEPEETLSTEETEKEEEKVVEEAVEKETSQEQPAQETARDSFVEGLRYRVDNEYREKVNQEKENKTREAHEKKEEEPEK